MAVAFDPMIIEPLDRLALETEIAAALGRTTTRIYLDTNVLMWSYGLHQGARADLCHWLKEGPQAGRIHVPRRVIHEFSGHRDASEKLYPFGQQFKPLAGLMERFEQMAPLVADDAWAASNGFGDRANYLQQVAAARTNLGKLIGPLVKGEKLEKLHEQLLPVFNSLALDGDVFSDLAALRQAYEARAELRVPPGFRDMRKGRAAEAANVANGDPPLAGANRFGDLAIWEEVLRHIKERAADTTDVIIITHDTKPDWSHVPGKIIDSDGHTKPNPQSGPTRLTVAQPMLVHELACRTSAKALYIITVPQLAVIANAHEVGFKFSELARAVQVEVVEPEDDAAITSSEDAGDKAPTVEAAGPVNDGQAPAPAQVDPPQLAQGSLEEFLAAPPVVALADGDYASDPAGPPELDATITALRASNWYVQNPAVRDAEQLLVEGRSTLLQAFVLGRNLYQAAVGTAAEAMRLLEDFSTRSASYPEDLANALYAGAMFELYFDAEGHLRHVPKDGQVGELLSHQTNPRLARAVGFIRARLAGAHLLVVPSTEGAPVQITISFDEAGAITGLLHADKPIAVAHDEADIGASPLPEQVSWARLRDLIGGYFAAPVRQLDLQPRFEDVRPVADVQFIRWDPIDGPDLT